MSLSLSSCLEFGPEGRILSTFTLLAFGLNFSEQNKFLFYKKKIVAAIKIILSASSSSDVDSLADDFCTGGGG